jgi:hypothetical protein
MTGVIQSIAATFFGAFILGMTTLAYKDYQAFKRLLPWLVAIYVAVGIAGFSFEAGLKTLWETLQPVYMGEVGISLYEKSHIATPLTVTAFFAVGLYFIVLFFLPRIIGPRSTRPS